jgi:hypothetical protein
MQHCDNKGHGVMRDDGGRTEDSLKDERDGLCASSKLPSTPNLNKFLFNANAFTVSNARSILTHCRVLPAAYICLSSIPGVMTSW